MTPTAPPVLVLRPTKLGPAAVLAAGCLLVPAMLALLAAVSVVIGKLLLFWGPGVAAVGAAAGVLLAIGGIAAFAYVGNANQKARIVADEDEVAYYGLGGRLEEHFSRGDVGTAVYQPLKAARSTSVRMALLLDKQGRLLPKTSGQPGAWGGELPKLWAFLELEPVEKSEAISGKELQKLYPKR